MNNTPSNIDILVAKWLANQLEGDEKKQFTEWLAKNPDAENEIKELKQIWDHSGALEVPRSKSNKTRWEKINNSITPRLLTQNVFYRVASVAAIFILIFVSVLYIRSKQVTIVVQNAEIENITLPDESHVIINSESSLEYNRFFWYIKRTVTLNGEGFFEVQKENIPFVVKTNQDKIKVMGTSFNVRQRNQKLTVACFSGSVKVFPRNNNEIILEKGKMVILENDNTLLRTFDTNNNKITSWINRKLHFEDTPLDEVFREIERHYDVKIDYNGPDNLSFTGDFDTNDLNEVLEIICKTANLSYSINKSSVNVTK